MKNLVGIVLGALLAITIGCAAKQSKSPESPQATMAGAPDAAAIPSSPPGDEIARLDAAISADMAKLEIRRPTAPPLTCVGAACGQEMSRLATAIYTPPQVCTGKTAKTETCKDVCALRDSICDNAGRICKLASQLGTDDNANDKCNQGKASCDAATERCCGCL